MDNNPSFIEKSQLLPSTTSSGHTRSGSISGNRTPDLTTPSVPKNNEETTRMDHSGRACEAKPLPCLFNNSSIVPPKQALTGQKKQEFILATLNLLSPYHKKQAEVLHLNVQRLVDLAPSENHIGFLTLTFPDNVTDHQEAYKRFRSMNSNFLKKSSLFKEWVCTKERQKRGAWHYHLLVQMTEDIRTGFDFKKHEEAQKYRMFNFGYHHEANKYYRQKSKEAYGTASPFLKSIWKLFREELPKYGFGRAEMLPIMTNKDGIARYIGKYIGKHMGEREKQDRGVRLVNYSKKWVKNSVKFQWHTENSQKWRKNLKMFVNRYGNQAKNEDAAMLYMRVKYGSHWIFNYAQDIINFDQIVSDEQKTIPF